MASRRNRDDRPTMIHCDRCGEDYSSTYKRCPFCEEMDYEARQGRYSDEDEYENGWYEGEDGENFEEDEEGHKSYPELTDGATVTMGGVIGSYKRINTRSGAPMAFISVEDLYGNIECVAFPNVYEKIRSIVVPDKIVRLSGKMQLDDEKAPVIILDKMQEFTGGAAAPAENAAAPVKVREHALWLNASALTEEEFD